MMKQRIAIVAMVVAFLGTYILAFYTVFTVAERQDEQRKKQKQLEVLHFDPCIVVHAEKLEAGYYSIITKVGTALHAGDGKPNQVAWCGKASVQIFVEKIKVDQ